MGAWGDGIFESDSALDEFSRTFDELLFRLRFSVDRDCPAETRVLAHMVGLMAAGCAPHDSYTKANAVDWRNRALDVLMANRSEGDEKYISNCRELITATFEGVIQHAAPFDSESEPDAFEDRYAIWREMQRQIETIDRYEIARRVLESRRHIDHDAVYWEELVEKYDNA